MQTLNHLLELIIQAFEDESTITLLSKPFLFPSPSLPFKENHLSFMAFQTMNLLSFWVLSHFILSPYFWQFFIAKEQKKLRIKWDEIKAN